jgi:NitT/TauT family transport system ATP-binding protein
MRLVLHAPTEGALRRARSSARALLASLPEAEIEIVVNAEGVRAAIDTSDPATDGLIVYCGNSLRQQGLPTPHAPVVSAAVRYLAERQAAGWAYIRA